MLGVGSEAGGKSVPRVSRGSHGTDAAVRSPWQCCNDMVQERFAPELKYDVALRLAALHIHLHALSSGTQGKVTVKSVEQECGLKRFVPASLLETMKRKELRKLLGHFLKQNQALSAPGQKQLTALQAKLHYLKIVGELPSYGSKCFSTTVADAETAVLVGPKFGISQINNVRSNLPTQPVTLAHVGELSSVTVRKEDETSYVAEVRVKDPDRECLRFTLEDNEMAELVFILKGYHKLLASRDLPVHWEVEESRKVESAPRFHGQHTVCPTPWSYPPVDDPQETSVLPTVDLSLPPPPYVPCELPDRGMSRSGSRERCGLALLSNSVDHNMNETGSAQLAVAPAVAGGGLRGFAPPGEASETSAAEGVPRVKFDIMGDEEEDEEDEPSVVETKNDRVLRRVSEMRRMVADAESYLSDLGDARESAEDSEARRCVRAADSLLLLTQLDGVREAVDDVAVAATEEASPSESDADSFGTPTESPCRRTSRPAGAAETAATRGRSGSSFGLHSPDVLPGLGSGDGELLELLKRLQSDPDIQLPFAEGTLYLDPDIIDLTMIPPPMTPDADLCNAPGMPDVPPTPFLDGGPTSSTDVVVAREDEGHEGSVDSARVVAELDGLCDALTEMRDSGDEARYRALFRQLGCRDLDAFIASATVPPPPSADEVVGDAPDDISSYIIPPPPPSCNRSTEVQNQVLARFQKASEDIRRIMTSEEPVEHPAAVEPPPLEALKVCDALTNGGYGGLLVADVTCGQILEANGEYERPRVPPRVRKAGAERERAGSCDGIAPKPQRQVARSRSWNSLRGLLPPSASQPARNAAGKPPIPLGSPSVQERRLQLGRSFRAGSTFSSDDPSLSGSLVRGVSGSPQLVRRKAPSRTASLGRAAGLRTLNGFSDADPLDAGFLREGGAAKSPWDSTDGPYVRAQQEVSAMMTRLDEGSPTARRPASRDALLAESRRFVTASKLFVKSATEGSDRVLDHLVTCVALLDRMFAAGEACGPALCGQLKAVATAYVGTVGAAAGAAEDKGATMALMGGATELASTLTLLMRTLRSADTC